MRVFRVKKWNGKGGGSKLGKTRAKTSLGAAKSLLIWAREKGTPQALAWAEKKLEREYGLDMDLKPIPQSEREEKVRQLESELNSYKHTPNTTFWKKK